jgi:signal peptidase I
MWTASIRSLARNMRKHLNFVAWVIVLSAISYFCVVNWGISLTEVSGPSMHPTYHDQDKVLVYHWPLLWRNPHKGEVVIAWQLGTGDYIVKRIGATPGDRVINPDGTLRPLGKDQYFLIGDNATNSYDSRYFGPVHRVQIVGIIE